MKFYLKETVYEAAVRRINWLFDEFKTVCVTTSGGKDSTVVLQLALKIAEERGRLPLPVMFVDQEAEWQNVIDHIRTIMYDPRVTPYWLQLPFRLFNATSVTDPWLHCWEPGKKWIHPQDPKAITVNDLGTDRFIDIFRAACNRYFGDGSCLLGGVRCEESPSRLMGLTKYETYKGETWGKILKPGRQYTFYPIYDWALTDVWKAIHDNDWPYCKLYDYQYQYGIAPKDMRVSNVHHETAVKNLFYLQEVEPDTWNRIVERLAGINTAGQLRHGMFMPSELPPMFENWREYRDYLLENLIQEPEFRDKLRQVFKRNEGRYDAEATVILNKVEVNCIMVNDFEGAKIASFTSSHASHRVAGNAYGKYLAGQEKIAQDRINNPLVVIDLEP